MRRSSFLVSLRLDADGDAGKIAEIGRLGPRGIENVRRPDDISVIAPRLRLTVRRVFDFTFRLSGNSRSIRVMIGTAARVRGGISRSAMISKRTDQSVLLE